MSAARTVRAAARRLRRAPTFAAAAALTLTLGLGAAVAVFAVVDAVLLRPLPYARPDQLVDLSHVISLSGATAVDQSDATFLYYRRENRVFTGVGAYRATAAQLGAVLGTNGAGDD